MNSGELKVDVPLAAVEDVDDDESPSSAGTSPRPQVAGSSSSSSSTSQRPSTGGTRRPPLPASSAMAAAAAAVARDNSKSRSSSVNRRGASPRFNLDSGDSAAGSLEDLVNSFDEKITKVFQDYQENVSKIAPVQVRSQEEIMNECQVWWTITGNFGNMMPIDWSKSTARARHLPTLNLNRAAQSTERLDDKGDEEEDDDIVAADLDMHALILNSNPAETAEPLKSADEVIKEIDDMIEAEEDEEGEGDKSSSADASSLARHFQHPAAAGFSSCQRSSRIVTQALAGRKLEELSTTELTQILSDVELLVRELSEELIADLGVRDELEYEKELKNTFISLLLSIQSKRRQHLSEGGHRTRKDPRDPYKYLTTVIPYQPDRGAPPVAALQVLVKILKAINEDSPAVPALLTDYILKVLCPS